MVKRRKFNNRKKLPSKDFKANDVKASKINVSLRRKGRPYYLKNNAPLQFYFLDRAMFRKISLIPARTNCKWTQSQTP